MDDEYTVGAVAERRCRACKLWAHLISDGEWGMCWLAEQKDAPLAHGPDSYVDTRADFGCVKWERKT
jgi:hypothetical protein